MRKKALFCRKAQTDPRIVTESHETFGETHDANEINASQSESLAPVAEEAKKQPSRKGKKAWRKNIDLTSVEKTLEAIEQEKLTFGAKISEAADSELFSINVKGDAKVVKEYRSTYDKILAKRSAVPALLSCKKSSAPRTKSKLELKVLKNTQLPRIGDAVETKAKDIWAEEDAASKKRATPKEASPLDSLAPDLTKKAIVSDVELKHSGASYNPTTKDLEDLKAVRKQLLENAPSKEALKKARSLVKASIKDTAISAAEMVEPLEGLQEGPETEAPSNKITPRPSKALTKKERRKKLVKLEMARNAQIKRERKRLNSEFDNLSAIKVEVETALQAQAVKKEQTAKKRKLSKLLPAKKIGLTKVPIKNIAVASQPSSTLRQIQISSNLFKDHYVGFQERNLIEPMGKKIGRKKLRKPEFKTIYKSSLEY